MTIEILNNESWFRHHMIYHLEPIPHPRYKHVFLPVNRHYKPLGVITRDRVNYDHYMHQAMMFNRDPHLFSGVWWNAKTLHMYNDGADSRKSYFTRLEKLFSYQVHVRKELVYGHLRSA